VIRVLIVDDMLTIRMALRYILESDAELTVVGEAGSGEEALSACRKLRPDIVTMDINMPGMGGYEAIRQIMNEIPCPIVVITGIESQYLMEVSFKALEFGALTVLPTPKGPSPDNADAKALIHQIKAMAAVKVVRRRLYTSTRTPPLPRSTVLSTVSSKESLSVKPQKGIELVAMGLSTGGPPALQTVLNGLPSDFQLPIVIVQHISQGFIFGLASWLNKTTPFRCKVGEIRETIKPGNVYLAPDNAHMTVTSSGELILDGSESVNGHRPSVSVLFESLAQNYGPKALGILLTGMGQDGATGLLAMRQAGSYTIAQDEASSVIFSMPKAAIELNAVEEVLDINQIAFRLKNLVENNHENQKKLNDYGKTNKK
jgi:two-component system, chemotaxis family, protein-glutamate methylesterase/glutaminase